MVNEKIELIDEFAFSSAFNFRRTRDQIEILDNTHYITKGLAMGFITTLSLEQPVHMLDHLNLAPGLQILAQTYNWANAYRPSLAVLEPGAELFDGTSAAGRRVHLPWGDVAFDASALNTDGRTIMKRAIEWAANREQP